MKVSEITVDDVAKYIRLDEASADDRSFLTSALEIAKKFISDDTGIESADLDKHDDFVIVVLVLCQSMYDDRTLYVDKTNLNTMVAAVLGHHQVNLL